MVSTQENKVSAGGWGVPFQLFKLLQGSVLQYNVLRCCGENDKFSTCQNRSFFLVEPY